jgi:hypothetical protein
VERDGHLVFEKSKDRDAIKSVRKWMDAFHVFVVIYTEKYPQETASLMSYAKIIRDLAEGCGDQAALMYNEKFRRWRQRDPPALPMADQDAIMKGISGKINNKQQPFRWKHRYCFNYNNHGSCKDGSSCPNPLVSVLWKHCQKSLVLNNFRDVKKLQFRISSLQSVCATPYDTRINSYLAAINVNI